MTFMGEILLVLHKMEDLL